MRNRLAITYLKPSTISPAPFQDLRRLRAKYDHAARSLPSRRRRLVSAHVRGADARAGRGLAGDPLRPQHADRRADGFRQDAGRIPGCDRRSGPPRRRAGAAGRDRRRLRLAAEGAVERRAHQSRSADRRYPRRAPATLAARRRNPHDGAHRRHAAGRPRQDAQAAAAYRGHDAGIAVHPAGFGIRPAHAVDDAHGDRRRSARARAEQARQSSCAFARAAGCAVRTSSHAHWSFCDAEADRRGGEVLDGFSIRVAEPGPSFRR